jgi:hypothetical protein
MGSCSMRAIQIALLCKLIEIAWQHASAFEETSIHSKIKLNISSKR